MLQFIFPRDIYTHLSERVDVYLFLFERLLHPLWAMHHVYHSYLQPQWDKNFAAVTSIWDRMFGTLYVPQKDKHTPWGIGPETQGEYRSFWQNTIGPFRDWCTMLWRNESDR